MYKTIDNYRPLSMETFSDFSLRHLSEFRKQCVSASCKVFSYLSGDCLRPL